MKNFFFKKKYIIRLISILLIKKVVGAEEENTNSVNIRNRDDAGTKTKGQTIQLEEAVEKLVNLKNEKRLKNSLTPDDM